jgi:hypothetical protein
MKVLPLKFKYENGKMLLTENYSYSKLNIGDELISMNKIDRRSIETCAKDNSGSERRKSSDGSG